MSKFLKTLIVAGIALAGMSFTSAAEAVKAVPGAALFVYNYAETAKPAPDADPIAVVVDTAEQFTQNNLHKNKETAKFYRQRVFLVWSGFISIPKKGAYVFSLTYNDNSNNDHSSVIFQMSNRDFLAIIGPWNKTPKLNDSRSLLLDKGNYEIKLICRAPHSPSFSLKMWARNRPFKKYEITPATMVHVE